MAKLVINYTDQVGKETSSKRYWAINTLTLIAISCSNSSTDSSPINLDTGSSVTGNQSTIESVDESTIVSDGDSETASNDETETDTSGNIDADQVLASVLSLLNTEVLDKAVDSVPNACSLSGIVTTVDSAGASGGTREYRNCEVQSTQVNGQFRRFNSSATTLINFENFSIVRDDSQIFIERGSFEHRGSNDQSGPREWRWADTVYSNNTADDSTGVAINEVVLLKKDGIDAYSADVNATITLNGDSFSVSTDTPLESMVGDNYYTSGQILISHEDGFSLLVDADGGDPGSALVTTVSNGSIDSQLRSWSESFFIECLTERWPLRPTINCD